jgi:hypothetical protein
VPEASTATYASNPLPMAVMAGNAAQTSSAMPAEISFLRPVPSMARVDRSPASVATSYLETRKESTVWPVSETCFRRSVFPLTSITLNEWTCEMNLSVKACQLAGSVCCSGL